MKILGIFQAKRQQCFRIYCNKIVTFYCRNRQKSGQNISNIVTDIGSFDDREVVVVTSTRCKCVELKRSVCHRLLHYIVITSIFGVYLSQLSFVHTGFCYFNIARLKFSLSLHFPPFCTQTNEKNGHSNYLLDWNFIWNHQIEVCGDEPLLKRQ